MADAADPEISVPEEETPSQRQARIRRQKREAKITSNAGQRLDKITRLSGRVPESSEFLMTADVHLIVEFAHPCLPLLYCV